MPETLITSKTFRIGALYRKMVMVRLDELGLPYVEHRTLVDSTIIVRLFTNAHIGAYNIFAPEMKAFIARLQEIDDAEENERYFKKMEKKNEKLARKNRWRRITLRKPLARLK